MLDAHLLAEQLVRPAGDVAGGVDAGRPAASVASQTTPSRSSSPLPSSHAVAGATPMPTTTTSAGDERRRRPGARRRRDSSATATPQRMSMPSAAWTAVAAAPISAPRPRISGAGSALEHGHRAAPGPGRRGHLEADEPGADDDDPGRAVGDHAPAGRARRRACAARGPSARAPGRAAAGCAEPVAMTSPSNGTTRPSASVDGAAVDVEPDGRHAEAQVEAELVDVVAAGAARCGRAPSRRPAASSTAAGGRRAGAARRRSA